MLGLFLHGTYEGDHVGGLETVGGGDVWRLVSATLLTRIVLPIILKGDLTVSYHRQRESDKISAHRNNQIMQGGE